MQVGGVTNVVAFQGSASGTPPDRGAAGASASASPSNATAASLPALQAAIIDANRALRAMNRGLEFELDPASGRLITRLVDTSDNEVLRQIPSEEMLRIAEALDRVQGLLIEQHA
ncbi:MAG: flagellar protein FlaG [Betaproteobacteria bacterium]